MRWLCFGLLLPTLLANAGVVRVEIAERADLPEIGYERLAGKVYYAVDPQAPANRKIVDIDLAPKNSAGLVEFSADVLLYRPKDAAKSNGTALLEIPNRGRGLIDSGFNVGGADLRTARTFDDKFLFEQGFTLVWVGWQFDLPGGLKLYAPSAKGVSGPVRAEILVDQKSTEQPLADRTMIPYAAADPATAKMTVHDSPFAARVTIPRAQWSFNAEGTKVSYPAGFQPGRIYEVVYTAQDPAIAGLGFAAVRDYAAYLKEQGEAKRVLAFGASQSGRYLRSFLQEGFNASEKGKQALEGVWAHIAGAGRILLNQRFAQPSRGASGPLSNVLYPSEMGAFASGDILDAARSAGVAPKLVLTNGAWEYWGRAASLTQTTEDGAHDVPIAEEARQYFVAGMQHVSGAGNRENVQNALNPTEWRWFLRATLVAMNAWITNGTAPPPSRIPTVAGGDLVPLASWKFPMIPKTSAAKAPYIPARLDFGPEFASRKIVTLEPPKVGPRYGVRVPQVNKDGNELAGVAMPDIAVPLATYTGWNPRAAKLGGAGSLFSQIGSMIPFARTEAERMKSGDPRASLEVRYRDAKEYLQKVEAAAQRLAKDRFLLDADIPRVVAAAKLRWEQAAK